MISKFDLVQYTQKEFDPEKDCGTVRCPYACENCPVYQLDNFQYGKEENEE